MSREPRSFENAVVNGGARIILVGPSNIGKSQQASDLQENADFAATDVDARIEDKLKDVMVADGVVGVGIQAVAAWMGSPHSEDPSEREKFVAAQARYLDLETGEYRKIIETEVRPYNTLIDTTGSFVHCPSTVQQKLARTGVVVYLRAEREDLDGMLASYVKNPKPVVWGKFYTQRAGESREDSIARSYAELLAARDKMYSSVADVTIPKSQAWDMSAGEFQRHIAESMRISK